MKRSSLQSGFSLIEMIVSLALFSVVATISVGALLVLIATNQQLQNEQSVMTNLSFALDSMTREIRTGTRYFCDSRPNFTANHSGGLDNMFSDSTNLDTEFGTTTTRDCANGNNSGQDLQGILFVEGGDSITGAGDRILYFYDADNGQIFRRVGAQPAQSIISSGIYITDAEFFVTGADDTDVNQSVVTVFLEAREANDLAAKKYEIQTTVTQRTLDI